ncbi:MAG TPA: hypothetical protein VHW25_17735 [Steroidobacteraceae bacterium]|nr:hypothetical protein [Steroidobacteraceae bacterium]
MLWRMQDIHYAHESTPEEIGSVFFFPSSAAVSPHVPAMLKRLLHLHPVHDLSQDFDAFPAATFPATPLLTPSSAPAVRAAEDWQQALGSVAADIIEQAKTDDARAARMRKPQPSPSFQPLRARPHDLEWISRHSRLVISAQGVPEWVLIQPCDAVVLLKDPDCTIEHIEPHGVMFEYMQQQHDATLGYGGANAVP